MKALGAMALVGASVIAGLVAGFALGALKNPTGQPTRTATPEPDTFFVAKEKEVWDALKSKNKAADSQLLAEDFVGLYDTGFAVRSDHVKQMDDSYAIRSYTIQDSRVVRVDPKTALLLYKATCEASGDWEDFCSRPMYVSSLWVDRNGRWVNLFSQDTPAAKNP